MKRKYKDWTLIDWDGNPDLKHKCWRKSFHNGHVSVGVGDFDLICYSYGANSDYSCSGTRSRKAYHREDQTEAEAMAMVDRMKGRNGGSEVTEAEHEACAKELGFPYYRDCQWQMWLNGKWVVGNFTELSKLYSEQLSLTESRATTEHGR